MSFAVLVGGSAAVVCCFSGVFVSVFWYLLCRSAHRFLEGDVTVGLFLGHACYSFCAGCGIFGRLGGFTN